VDGGVYGREDGGAGGEAVQEVRIASVTKKAKKKCIFESCIPLPTFPDFDA
jgi:hypothetical protein